MSKRDDVVEAARGMCGEAYYSMNYGAEEGFGGVGTHYVGAGFGCAELASYAYNVTLGTRYVGSTYNFFGDALGDDECNQGGGEFYLVDDPEPGDVVCYIAKGHDGTDYFDCGHVALYSGDGMVIGAWGIGIPGNADYWPGRGVSEDPISAQSLGNGWRYCRCRRLDEADEDEVPDEGEGAVYRLFDARSGNHHWTRDRGEAKALASWGWTYEGVAWYAPTKGDKVWRCYDPDNGDHVLTCNASEVLQLLDWGWRYEGVAMRSGKGAEVHRLTLPKSGLHFYTSDARELASVRQWMDYEGVAFHAR